MLFCRLYVVWRLCAHGLPRLCCGAVTDIGQYRPLVAQRYNKKAIYANGKCGRVGEYEKRASDKLTLLRGGRLRIRTADPLLVRQML